MWSVLDLMGPILGHTPCLWHLTHHSSLILQVSEVAGSEIISTTRCNWGSPRESCAKKKNVSGWWWSTRKNPQGEFDKAVAVLPAGSTTINPHLWSDLPWGLPAAGPLPVLLWQWDKDFPAPKARQRMPGTCFSMEHTNNTCLFGGCVHASFGCWTKKTCSLDWGKQKPEPQLLYGLICFFSNCGTVSGILEDVHHVQLPTLPFFPWAGQPVLGGLGGASPSNWTASSPEDGISTYQVYTWDFPGFCEDYYQDTYDVHWFYTFWGMNRMNHP